MNSIKDRINLIRKDLPDKVSLVAVSKTRNLDEMEEAYDAGVRDFGENKVQELVPKIENFHKDVRWHLIGHLQTNKVKYIVGKVFLIHSLDSLKLLYELEKRYSRAGLIANTLVEINIAEEESKTGILLKDVSELLNACEECKNVRIKGLMGVMPKGAEETVRRYFKKLKSIWEDLKTKDFKNIEMKYLSMGMTSDYKIAVEEGTNMVRIGEGIFGKRNYNIKED